MEHTCHTGPLCQNWDKWDECQHTSCQELVMEQCQACIEEAMDEAAWAYARWEFYDRLLKRGWCPVDLTRIQFQAVVGAPGYGTIWSCKCHHEWGYDMIRGHYFDPTEYLPELTIWDVL